MPGQIWRDDCYYRDHMGECQPHFVLILAVCQQHNDAVTVTFTSKPNGLTVTPPCSSGPPRAGYFVGMPGGKLHKESWADLQSIDILDHRDFCLHVGQKRKSLEDLQLPPDVFCAVLRCALKIQDDITKRQRRLLADLAANLRCP